MGDPRARYAVKSNMDSVKAVKERVLKSVEVQTVTAVKLDAGNEGRWSRVVGAKGDQKNYRAHTLV